MHHALADGISGMLIASALFDLSPDADVGTPPKEPWVPEPAPTGLELAADAVHDLVLHPMEALVRVAEAPMHAAAVIGETLDGLRSIVGMGAPPRGPFDVRVGPNRRFATAEVPFARPPRRQARVGWNHQRRGARRVSAEACTISWTRAASRPAAGPSA